MMLEQSALRRGRVSRVRALAGVALVVFMLVFASLARASAASAAISLSLPQSTAFTVLGHSCGGIQEQAFTTGFATQVGYATGDVYLQTRCSTGGRGGGTTTFSAWTSVTWSFGGAVSSYSKLTAAPTGLSPTFTATDAYGDTVYNALTALNINPSQCTVGNTTYCTYRAYVTSTPPAAPTGVTAAQVGDQFKVGWTPAAATAPVLTSSTITATPIGSSAPVLKATITGTATSGLVGPLQPSTTYQITVVNSDAGGPGAASSPITATSQAATLVPGTPTGVSAGWTYSGTLSVKWGAAASGNSPIDSYQVTASAYNPDPPAPPPVSQTVSGTTLSTALSVDNAYDWSVQVRAHNSAGWGAWSTAVIVPALGG